jgi:flavin reductase (DIM6/NTAB) family NADH-FMN oxidoreductase RutF
VSVSFSTTRSGGDKDTLANIRSTRNFVVNLISEPFSEAANACSVDAPPEIDEFALSGLTPEASEHMDPPRVKESAVSLAL